MTLKQLVYRSIAVQTLAPRALQHLVASARQRNAREGLTGLLVVDHDQFVQWLEGPEAALERVWRAIRRDPRHCDIERLHTPWRAQRLFPDWAMQIGVAAGCAAPRDALVLDPVLIGARHASRAQAAELPCRVALQAGLPDAGTLAQWCAGGHLAHWDRLADQLVAAQPSLQVLNDVLLGPVSRALGDAWLQDTVDGTALHIATSRLQVLLRRIGAGLPVAPATGRSALVAAAPGETHLQGVTLAAVAFDAMGWQVGCCFPADADQLLAALATQHHDVLQLALSDSMAREHQLADVAALLRAARRASPNPQLQVLLSGRALAQQPGLAVLLGADGNGLAHGIDGAELQTLLGFAEGRRHSPGAMAAQATLNDVALQMQRRRFGLPQERAAAGSA